MDKYRETGMLRNVETQNTIKWMAGIFILLVVKLLKFWANGGQIGGQIDL